MRGKVSSAFFILSAVMAISEGKCLTQFCPIFYKASNRALQHHSYQAKTTSTAVICGRDCSMDARCASFNYHESNHLCEMNIGNRSMDACNFVELTGSAYFDNNYETLLLSASLHAKYQTCRMLFQAGHLCNGIYTIYLFGMSEGMQVYCDMATAGGGWIVFQRRQDGSVDFYRDWTDYQSGFGNLSGEFWLGNNNLRKLTASGNFELRVDLKDWEGSTAWAEYGQFEIIGEKYTLNIGSYNALSTAGNSMAYHNRQKFSTKDQDNDSVNGNCAQVKEGAWWFNGCAESNLNGKNYNHANEGSGLGLRWYHWKIIGYSYKECSMKLREVL